MWGEGGHAYAFSRLYLLPWVVLRPAAYTLRDISGKFWVTLMDWARGSDMSGPDWNPIQTLLILECLARSPVCWANHRPGFGEYWAS